MKKLIILTIVAVLFCPFVFSQTDKAKPDWAINPLHIQGKTSKLVTISAYDITQDDTRKSAFKSLEEGGRKLNEGYRIIEEFWEYKGNWAYGYFLVQISAFLFLVLISEFSCCHFNAPALPSPAQLP